MPGPQFDRTMKRLMFTLMPDAWFDYIQMIRGNTYPTYLPLMQALKDYDERKHPSKAETAGVSLLADSSKSRPASETPNKNGKTSAGASKFKDAITAGDFSGLTTADFHAYMTQHAKKNSQKTEKKTAKVYSAKGKGSGKGSYKPRDRSGDTCNNCDKKGHWAPECPAPRRDQQSNHRPVSSGYVAKGKGKGKGKGTFKKNQTAGSAPY